MLTTALRRKPICFALPLFGRGIRGRALSVSPASANFSSFPPPKLCSRRVFSESFHHFPHPRFTALEAECNKEASYSFLDRSQINYISDATGIKFMESWISWILWISWISWIKFMDIHGVRCHRNKIYLRAVQEGVRCLFVTLSFKGCRTNFIVTVKPDFAEAPH